MLQEIPHKKVVANGQVIAPQSPRYTCKERLMSAKNLDEVF